MCYGLFQIGNCLDSHLIVQKFCSETFGCSWSKQLGRIMTFQSLISSLIGIKNDPTGSQGRTKRGQVRQAGSMYQQAIESVADTDPTCLGIIHNGFTLIQVARSIEIRMTDSGPRFNHRDGRFFPNIINQPTASPGNDQIYIPLSMQKSRCSFTVGRKQFHYMRVHTETVQYIMNNPDYRTVGRISITSSFQDASAATLQAKRKDIEAHIRTRLINDTDNSERDTDFPEMQPVGTYPVIEYPSERRR